MVEYISSLTYAFLEKNITGFSFLIGAALIRIGFPTFRPLPQGESSVFRYTVVKLNNYLNSRVQSSRALKMTLPIKVKRR